MKHLEEVIINYDKKLMKANQEIKRLHNIIEEAIEYIEKKLFDSDNHYEFDIKTIAKKDLLEILKGSDKE